MNQLTKTQTETAVSIGTAIVALLKSDKDNLYYEELMRMSEDCKAILIKLQKEMELDRTKQALLSNEIN